MNCCSPLHVQVACLEPAEFETLLLDSINTLKSITETAEDVVASFEHALSEEEKVSKEWRGMLWYP